MSQGLAPRRCAQGVLAVCRRPAGAKRKNADFFFLDHSPLCGCFCDHTGTLPVTITCAIAMLISPEPGTGVRQSCIESLKKGRRSAVWIHQKTDLTHSQSTTKGFVRLIDNHARGARSKSLISFARFSKGRSSGCSSARPETLIRTSPTNDCQ